MADTISLKVDEFQALQVCARVAVTKRGSCRRSMDEASTHPRRSSVGQPVFWLCCVPRAPGTRGCFAGPPAVCVMCCGHMRVHVAQVDASNLRTSSTTSRRSCTRARPRSRSCRSSGCNGNKRPRRSTRSSPRPRPSLPTPRPPRHGAEPGVRHIVFTDDAHAGCCQDAEGDGIAQG